MQNLFFLTPVSFIFLFIIYYNAWNPYNDKFLLLLPHINDSINDYKRLKLEIIRCFVIISHFSMQIIALYSYWTGVGVSNTPQSFI